MLIARAGAATSRLAVEVPDLFDDPVDASVAKQGKAPRPMADRLRPHRLADVVGQDHVLAPGAPLGKRF